MNKNYLSRGILRRARLFLMLVSVVLVVDLNAKQAVAEQMTEVGSLLRGQAHSSKSAEGDGSIINSSKRKKKKTSAPPAEINWRAKAEGEITVAPAEVSKSSASRQSKAQQKEAALTASAPPIAGTAATVVTTSEAVGTPVVYSGLQIGLSMRPYRGAGHVEVVGEEGYDASSLAMAPMVGLTLRWLPWKMANYGEPGLGFYAFGEYARQPVRLLGGSGASLGKTNLQTAALGGGFSAEWIVPQAPLWSVAVDLGAGRLDVIQTSVASIANTSDRRWFLAPAAQAKYHWGDVWLSLGISSGMGTRLADNMLFGGVWYGLR